jgi:hypothetical protein
LALIEAALRGAYYRSLIGRNLRVLVETPGVGTWLGTSCRYATVELPASTADEGRFVDVLADGVQGERISGTRV